MNIPKIGSIIDTTGKKLAGKASSGIPKETFIKMQMEADCQAAIARSCTKIYLTQKYPDARQRKAVYRSLLLKRFAGNARTAASELLNNAATRLSSVFKK